MRNAPEEAPKQVYRHFYFAYRAPVESAVCAAIERGSRVVHISPHSFALVLTCVVRCADVGLFTTYIGRADGACALADNPRSALALRISEFVAIVP
jgi:hypothetical protein